MARYLVTGGAGFIGSNICEALLKLGHRVRILDNFSTGQRSNLTAFGDGVEIIEGDIRSYHIVRSAVEGIDFVLHQAALPSVPRSIADPITSHEVNATGTLNILDAAKEANVKRVIFASSSSVYGDNEVLPKQEDMIPNPLSPYAVSKLAGENYCRVFYKLYGLQTVILRYFNVFGPRQDPNSQYSAVIPRFIKAMRQGRSPLIFGDGTQSRDFTYVQNVVDANLLACEAGDLTLGQPINCATHSRITLNELVESLNRILSTRIAPEYHPRRPGDILHSFADISRATRLLNYHPGVDFETGLQRTVEGFPAT